MASKSKVNLKSKFASSGTPKSLTKAENKAQTKCGICSSAIVDSSDSEAGEDSISCEATCQVWLHQTCAGLTVPKFHEIIKLNKKFSCVYCRLDDQFEVINDIKTNLSDIQAKFDVLLSSMNNLCSQQQHFYIPGGSDPISEVSGVWLPSSVPSQSSNGPKVLGASHANKLNLVVYGVRENTHGTSRPQRLSNDLKHLCDVFNSTNDSFSSQTIQDCLHVGPCVFLVRWRI